MIATDPGPQNRQYSSDEQTPERYRHKFPLVIVVINVIASIQALLIPIFFYTNL
jgi:hypothetical protein